MELGIVAREFSADESPKEQANTQRGLYFLTDNFFKFWYSFVFPNVSELEAGDTDGIWEYVVKGELNNFTSYAFEKICIEYLRKKNMENQLPFHFTKIGRWWNKVSEIDIMAMDHSRKNIILGECKYKNSPLDSHDINNTMKKYSADDNTNIYYWFFSKNGFINEAKEIATDVNAVLVDLDDLFV